LESDFPELRERAVLQTNVSDSVSNMQSEEGR
jgi:hypothetical protein